MLVFREGDLLDITIPYHLEHADKIIILLDNYDPYTEDKVMHYAKLNKDKIIVKYSNYGHFDSDYPGEMNNRFKTLEGQIREQLLSFVREENSRKPIDILTWFDADELPMDNLVDKLQWFVDSRYKAIRSKYIDVVGDYKHFTIRKILPHCRVFKYSEDFTTKIMVSRAMLYPIVKGHTIVKDYFTVHLPDYDIKRINKRSVYKKRTYAGLFVWESVRDVKTLTDDEIHSILSRQPLCTMEEYVKRL